MTSKEDLQKRLDEINQEINTLREETLKLVGKFELLVEQEKNESDTKE
ncbi:MAG: hypothetical protein WCQ47_07510 [bacterium]